MRLFAKFILAAGALLLTTPAWAQHGSVGNLIVGVPQSSPALWELETIKSLGLEKKHGMTLEIRELADDAATRGALASGDVDVILSDFVWVSNQRSQGNKITAVPFSKAAGGLTVPPGSAIAKLEDLKGKTIAVAGDPLDVNWVTLQAYYNSLTGTKLVDDATASFAPASESAGADAALNDWQGNARAKLSGATELSSVPSMLEALGLSETPPLLSWTFTDEIGKTRKAAIAAFLEASFAAREVLLSDDDAWTGLRTLMGADGDDALFAQLRDGYREAAVTTYNPSKMPAAKDAFALWAQFGGAELVGSKNTLDTGTFWRGFRK